MLYRRSQIEEAGGIRLLATEAAEDAATTKVVRDVGLRVRLVDAPFEQPLGYRSAARSVGDVNCGGRGCGRPRFRQYYALEILSGGLGPLLGCRLCRRGAGTGRWAALLRSLRSGMAPKPRSRAQPAGI